MNETQLGPDFSSDRLDGFLEEAGIDVALISSKHNVQYLLGGHRHHFFDYMDAVGVSRYLPIIVYIKGRPGEAAYIANRNEKDGLAMRQAERPGAWPPTVLPGASGSPDAMKLAIEHLRRSDALGLRVGIEFGFLPADAAFMLRYACTGPALLDAHRPLNGSALLRRRGNWRCWSKRRTPSWMPCWRSCAVTDRGQASGL